MRQPGREHQQHTQPEQVAQHPTDCYTILQLYTGHWILDADTSGAAADR